MSRRPAAAPKPQHSLNWPAILAGIQVTARLLERHPTNFPDHMPVRLSPYGLALFKDWQWPIPDRGQIAATLDRIPAQCVPVLWDGQDEYQVLNRLCIEHDRRSHGR